MFRSSRFLRLAVATGLLFPIASQAQNFVSDNRGIGIYNSWGGQNFDTEHAKLWLGNPNFGIGAGTVASPHPNSSNGAPNDNLYLFSAMEPNRDIRLMARPSNNNIVGTWQTNMIIKSMTGRVVIGDNANPLGHLQIAKSQPSLILENVGQATAAVGYRNTPGGYTLVLGMDNNNAASGFEFRTGMTVADYTGGTSLMNVYSTGKIGIGVANDKMAGDYKLYVAGGILTERCRVALVSGTEWRDDVFAADYKLQPLSEVETYVRANKHLPGVPSAGELVQDGIDVTQMLAAQMGKIEELTLHLIEAQKKMAQLEATIQALKAPEADKPIR